MITPKLYRMFAVPIVLALAVAACGGPSTAEPAPTEPPVAKPTITPPAPTRTPVPTGGITSYQDVQKATIQIVAQGTFRDPEVGLQANAAGAGSGFLISKDGLAVTNNHVVTGAARLKVFLEGQEYRAKLLGASECWDLAVIQLEGDDFPYLELYEGNVAVGLEVYAAGFPLGDPEFTLTKGIVSKARADGESSWASVDSVIEHDATINPGNSGGPLVNEEGQLVGINYAGSSSTNQYYAIKAQDAQRVIDQYLRLTSHAAAAPAPAKAQNGSGAGTGASTGSRAYANRKELAAVERKLEKVTGQIGALHLEIAEHDHSDYTGLGALTERLRVLEAEHTELEDRWLELSDDAG